ncbi:MAG: tRNA adenosine(34) deaminase TadA [Gammaproteobacteria bacterium]
MTSDASHWMHEALRLAACAERCDEVPVGAVVVLGGEIIGRGHNANITRSDPTAHAEIVALREAASRCGNHRLNGATLYVTLEPCPMCAGAIVHARIAHVVYGTTDPRAGAAGTVMDVLAHPALNHHPRVTGGVEAAASAKLLTEFFRQRRARAG